MVGLANDDTALVLDCLTDDVYSEQVGQGSIDHKTDVEHFLKAMLSSSVKEMTLTTLITHGDAGSVNDTMTLVDEKRYGFCHVFTFTSHGKNAKLKQIMSYIIQENARR
jgi:hypothetical protein